MDIDKTVFELRERLKYIQDIFGPKENENVLLLQAKLQEFEEQVPKLESAEQIRQVSSLEDLFGFLEKKLERQLSPMDKVRIVRHPQRISLKDILEHVYDNYTEIGGQDEYSVDPSMLIARAYITRRVGNKVHNQSVMVIGQEKGHGQEFRNGGSVKPWGNAKALQYMKVAETENIPIHAYVNTPGAFPVEDYPGAAQQIARNIYEMAGLRVPVIAIFSEGGSGGAEAIGLADVRLMLSHGYYSVISPEGAAAIEGRIRQGQRVPTDLVEKCAKQLKITAEDNLSLGLVDRIVQEPVLGARTEHFDFFRALRQEVINATDEIILRVRGMNYFRAKAIMRQKKSPRANAENIFVRWKLSSAARERLLWKRYQRFMAMSRHAVLDRRSVGQRVYDFGADMGWSVYSFFKYDFLRKHQKKVKHLAEDVGAEVQVVLNKCFAPIKRIKGSLKGTNGDAASGDQCQLTQLSRWKEREAEPQQGYLSPKAKQDVTITCPNTPIHGCLDMWAPDLFGEWAGVCIHCGHHFSMEYDWYLHNVYDSDSVSEFNGQIEAKNPLGYEGLDLKLEEAKRKTGQKSSCVTFEATINGLNVVTAMLTAGFRGGSVGAAEGEKFIRAVERARKKHFPLIAYVHGTAGIRIQEGTLGVIQMPRCTMAVRRYLEDGGLYLVVYDTNSYAGPVASFLGCSPYQFAIRSSRVGFAGLGVIQETTGMPVEPHYHGAFQALSRGHIQGVWDRREMRKNVYQALLTVGGRNLYYR
ncbi:MAG: acetyl-CoA carboxylase carboxyl transferase subunit alpha/beta [Desulfovibrionales bacterium]|nr:MAG: acetyl-CoA carboxylase carboxyl transferase subunit alpha/beta [Desulfovibrionales bacterium]